MKNNTEICLVTLGGNETLRKHSVVGQSLILSLLIMFVIPLIQTEFPLSHSHQPGELSFHLTLLS